MTRQEQIKFIGQKAKISDYENKLNYFSYFIIPVPHKVFKNKNSYKELIKLKEWEILNTKKRAFDYSNKIKKYIYDNMIPPFNKDKKNNIVLRKKINESFILKSFAKDIEIKIEEIDLWILKEEIAFFVVKITLDKENILNVNDISSILNRTMRDFRKIYVYNNQYIYESATFINIKKWSNKIENQEKLLNRYLLKYFKIKKINKNGIFYFDGIYSSFIDWLFDMTKIDNKSFLNITKKEIKDSLVYNFSYYSKLLTAMHVEIYSNFLDYIEPSENNLKKIEIEGTDVLEEIPFLLATTSELYPTRSWEANEAYINRLADEGGINLWKYWSGIAIKDSLAFFSINDGGGMIVSDSKDINYFIYILNLYVNYKIKLLEHILIDESFSDIEKHHSTFLEVQKIHNQYTSEEIAVTFQPNEIHQSILSGLRTKELFEEVEKNIIKSYEIAKDNTSIIITIFMGFVAFIGSFLTKDKILEFYTNYPKQASILTIFVLIIAIIGIIERKNIMSGISNIINKIKNMKL